MQNFMQSLQEAVSEKKARIGILGLGYVGLPLALRFSEIGFSVSGIDIDAAKVEKLKEGIPDIGGISFAGHGPRPVRFSVDSALLKECDVVILCVPTPLSKTRDPDLSSVLDAARTVADNLRSGQLVVLESTTYPGTTRELLLPLLEGRGLRVGNDFFLAYSPERIDPGNEHFTLSNTPRVIAGITPDCLKLAQMLYSQIVERVVPVSSTDAAEMVKLLENTFRSVNIALVNEFAIMCRRLGLDIWEIIQAAGSKPFGFMPFYPGPGLGGHCIPVDPQYLSWKLKHLAYKARLIELADEINREMPRFVVETVVEALNRERKSVRGSRILILGVAYKKDSDDVRESPALDIMKLLHERGGEISYHDPYIPQIVFNDQILCSVPLTQRHLSCCEAAVIVADHSRFNAATIVDHAPLVIDARNLTRGIDAKKIVRL